MLASTGTLVSLIVTAIVNIILVVYLVKGQNKNQLTKLFIITLSLLLLWVLFLILQILLSIPLKIDPIYFDYIVYIAICFVPVSVYFLGICYSKQNNKSIITNCSGYLFISFMDK